MQQIWLKNKMLLLIKRYSIKGNSHQSKKSAWLKQVRIKVSYRLSSKIYPVEIETLYQKFIELILIIYYVW